MMPEMSTVWDRGFNGQARFRRQSGTGGIRDNKFPPTARSRLIALAIVLSAAACADGPAADKPGMIVGPSGRSDTGSPTAQIVDVRVDPSDARCSISGKGLLLEGAGLHRLPFEATPISISCERAGYRSVRRELTTEQDRSVPRRSGGFAFFVFPFPPIMTTGDAWQAMRYPPLIHIVLEPANPAPEQRAAWIQAKSREVRERWGQFATQQVALCKETNQQTQASTEQKTEPRSSRLYHCDQSLFRAAMERDTQAIGAR